MKTIVMPISACSRHHLVLHVAADQRVERAERLVEEHDLRVRRRAPGRDRRAAACRLRAGPGTVRRRPRGRRGRSISLGAGKALRLRHALHLEAERDVVDHAAVRRAGRSAGTPSRPCGGAGRGGRSGRAAITSRAVDLDRPCSRLDQPDQRAHERRLPRAGEPHDDEHLAGPDVERDVPDGGDAAGLRSKLAAREVGVRACRRCGRHAARRPSRRSLR